jgi:hypothetical protein
VLRKLHDAGVVLLQSDNKELCLSQSCLLSDAKK